MFQAQLEQVRRFNRLVTRRVGALDDSYLRRGRPLGEARLIYEIGAGGGEARALRERLGLDSGYLSRLLRSLRAQGLAELRRSEGDGRRRVVVLTAKGQAERLAYDRLSDELATSMLQPLETKQRERLASAMAEVERWLRAAAVTVGIEPPGGADANLCLDAYFGELGVRFDDGFDPKNNPTPPAEEMAPPAGAFVIARLDGAPIGCGALTRVDGATGEIKRVWTAPSARGLGVARKMLGALEAAAREVGSRLCVSTRIARSRRRMRCIGPRDITRSRASTTIPTRIIGSRSGCGRYDVPGLRVVENHFFFHQVFHHRRGRKRGDGRLFWRGGVR